MLFVYIFFQFTGLKSASIVNIHQRGGCLTGKRRQQMEHMILYHYKLEINYSKTKRCRMTNIVIVTPGYRMQLP